MSYCRWSTDHFRCDLYVYESCWDTWEIHVAGMRSRWWRTLLFKLEYLEWNHIWRTRPDPYKPTWRSHVVRVANWFSRPLLWRFNWLQRYPINGPHDGENFHDHYATGGTHQCTHIRVAGM